MQKHSDLSFIKEVYHKGICKKIGLWINDENRFASLAIQSSSQKRGSRLFLLDPRLHGDDRIYFCHPPRRRRVHAFKS